MIAVIYVLKNLLQVMRNLIFGVIKIRKIQDKYLNQQIKNIFLIVINVIIVLIVLFLVFLDNNIFVLIVQIKNYVIIIIVIYVLKNLLQVTRNLIFGAIKIKKIQDKYLNQQQKNMNLCVKKIMFLQLH